MSDFPFSIPRRGDADVVNGVSYAGTTLTLTRAEGSDLTTTIPTAANPFVYKQSYLNGGAYIYSVPGWNSAVSTTEIEIDAISPLNITPTSASQTVVLQVSVIGEWSGAPSNANISLKRIIGVGASAVETWLDPRVYTTGVRMPVNGIFTIGQTPAENATTPETCNFTYVDNPNTTNQVTYELYVKSSSAQSFYLNRTVTDSDLNYVERAKSTFSAECKG